MRIQDKVVVITGGASGLGLATAKYLQSEKGARIAIIDMNVEAGEKAMIDLDPERTMFVVADVADDASVRAAIDTIMVRFGAVHVCINGAALAGGFKILDREGRAASLARFAATTAVNINGVFNVMSKCVEQMAKNEAEAGEERGVVINVSSGAAYEGQIGQTAYASSKAAIIGMNIPAARELGAIGVRVNAIAPGLFLTTMVAALDETILAALKGAMEAPKRLGDVREFAHTCAYIIENAYVNGETIRLDGAARLRAK